MPQAEPPSAARPSAHSNRRREQRLGRSLARLLLGLFALALLLPLLAWLASGEHRLAELGQHLFEDPAARQGLSGKTSPYGVCADLCTRDGSCRHVFAPNGWHRGTRLTDTQIREAIPCR